MFTIFTLLAFVQLCLMEDVWPHAPWAALVTALGMVVFLILGLIAWADTMRRVEAKASASSQALSEPPRGPHSEPRDLYAKALNTPNPGFDESQQPWPQAHEGRGGLKGNFEYRAGKAVDMDELEERVKKFWALELPGQPIGVHLGTLILVNDLLAEVKRGRAQKLHPEDDLQCPACNSTMDEIRECRKCGHTERR